MTAVVVRLLKVALKCKVFVSFYLWTKTNPSLPVSFLWKDFCLLPAGGWAGKFLFAVLGPTGDHGVKQDKVCASTVFF